LHVKVANVSERSDPDPSNTKLGAIGARDPPSAIRWEVQALYPPLVSVIGGPVVPTGLHSTLRLRSPESESAAIGKPALATPSLPRKEPGAG
jgi:hypothetical protein